MDINEKVSLLKELITENADREFLNDLSAAVKREKNFIDFSRFKQLQLNPEMLCEAPLNNIRNDVLIYRMFKIINTIRPNTIDINSYYAPLTQKEYDVFPLNDDDVEDLHCFRNVARIAQNQYHTVLSVAQVAALTNQSIIRADVNYQRESQIKQMTAREAIRTVHVNKERVRAIEDALVNKTYWFDEIKLALFRSDDSYCDYDEVNETLTWDGDCVIPDGNHRRWACFYACQDHPEMLDYFKTVYFSVSFTYVNDIELRALISQTWNQEPISRVHQKIFGSDPRSDLVRRIKDDKNADPHYTIWMVTEGQSFIAQGILADAIKISYTKEDYISLKAQISLANWIVAVYNEFADLYAAEIASYKRGRQSTWLTESYSPYAIIYLSSLIRDKNQWETLFRRTCQAIDWTNKPVGSSTGIKSRDIETIMKVVKEAYDSIQV